MNYQSNKVILSDFFSLWQSFINAKLWIHFLLIKEKNYEKEYIWKKYVAK